MASINFVTAHDGFTLRDLVSYNEKNNIANGEDNNDGESHNRSWNGGAEGETDDLVVLEIRARQQRNFITTLFLSQGVPMLLHGDEMGRTQTGNNNTYAQDSELSWVDWANIDESLMEFTSMVATLRANHPVFRRKRFFTGRHVKRAEGEPLRDVEWMSTDASAMTEQDWDVDYVKSIGMFLNGDGIRARDARGQDISDANFLLYFNASEEGVTFELPSAEYGADWDIVLDTSIPTAPDGNVLAGESITVGGRCVIVLRAGEEKTS